MKVDSHGHGRVLAARAGLIPRAVDYIFQLLEKKEREVRRAGPGLAARRAVPLPPPPR